MWEIHIDDKIDPIEIYNKDELLEFIKANLDSIRNIYRVF